MIAKDAVGDFLRLPLLVPLIPSGSSATLTFHFLLPSNVPDSFVLTAIGESQSPASGAGAYVDEAIAAAQTYLAQEFGLAVPPSMANELRDYEARNFQTSSRAAPLRTLRIRSAGRAFTVQRSWSSTSRCLRHSVSVTPHPFNVSYLSIDHVDIDSQSDSGVRMRKCLHGERCMSSGRPVRRPCA